ncbi:hypothetical protein [Bradyrhizobium lablabi]|uniref:hypothetical protein n=1 Tax=Bradyrhizobium lablabi TaxID=722472 RepID=UPI001BACCDCB|nr:hypothetical protein [Bradyrhizobium lablabi]MBR0696966.1 hypothetical protein [Bradyrhizobium lablabi]
MIERLRCDRAWVVELLRRLGETEQEIAASRRACHKARQELRAEVWRVVERARANDNSDLRHAALRVIESTLRGGAPDPADLEYIN